MKKKLRSLGATLAAGGVPAVLLAVVLAVRPASAHPGFAKKYRMSCFTCHAGVPKLNDFGERFRLNGYQLPGTIENVPVWDQGVNTIISGMVHEMYIGRKIENNMSVNMIVPPGEELDLSSFRHLSVELFSGGTLAPHLSYMMFVEIENELEMELSGPPPPNDNLLEEIEEEVEVEVESAFLVYNNVLGTGHGALNFRLGIFEVELPFSQIRALGSELDDYLVYGLTGTGEHGSFRLNHPQVGLSAYGLYDGFHYEIAVLNGSNSRFDTNTQKDLYLRAAYNFYELSDLIRRLRVGGFFYTGRENLGNNREVENTGVSRAGLDALLSLGRVEILAQWMTGRNDDTDPVNAGDQRFDFSGGFLEVDVNLKTEKLIGFLRYDRVDVDRQWDVIPMVVTATGNEDGIRRISAGVKWYFAPNWFLHAEVADQDNMLGHPESTEEAARVVDMDTQWVMLMLVADF